MSYHLFIILPFFCEAFHPHPLYQWRRPGAEFGGAVPPVSLGLRPCIIPFFTRSFVKNNCSWNCYLRSNLLLDYLWHRVQCLWWPTRSLSVCVTLSLCLYLSPSFSLSVRYTSSGEKFSSVRMPTWEWLGRPLSWRVADRLSEWRDVTPVNVNNPARKPRRPIDL